MVPGQFCNPGLLTTVGGSSRLWLPLVLQVSLRPQVLEPLALTGVKSYCVGLRRPRARATVLGPRASRPLTPKAAATTIAAEVWAAKPPLLSHWRLPPPTAPAVTPVALPLLRLPSGSLVTTTAQPSIFCGC